MKFLVTGGAGFIGSHVADGLILAGHTVRILDNLSTGSRENLNPQAEFVEGDIRDPMTVRRVLQGIDGVFHYAAIPSVQKSIEEPYLCHDINLTGTVHLLVAAKEAGVKKFLLSSSSAVYGETTRLPISEDEPAQPLSPYALHKYAGEIYLRMAANLWGMQTISLRHFNVYGPRMPLTGAYASVITRFGQQRLRGEALTIVGDGTQTRDFVYIDDVVTANMKALLTERLPSGIALNIGSEHETSVRDVAAMIGGATISVPKRQEIEHSLADISLAKKLLNWAPVVSLSTGLPTVLAWLKQAIN